LELVKQKLGVLGVAATRRDGRGEAASLPKARSSGSSGSSGGDPEKRRTAKGRRSAPPSPERREMLDEVERIVKAGSGISASEVARSAGIPQTRAAAALKQLKLAHRIFQGGDRRFARYAGDARTADKASVVARQTAKGPMVAPSRPASTGATTGAPAGAPKTPVTMGAPAPKPPAPSSTTRPRKRAQPDGAAPAA
jgi:hypothetical protein